MVRWWPVILAASCSSGGEAGQDGRSGRDGADGLTGPTGPAGATGPQGAPGPGGGPYRWHDANGEQVTEGPELSVWVDDLLWVVDPETTELREFYRIQRYRYAEPDCAGPEYISSAPLPRYALREDLNDPSAQYYVRADTATASLDQDIVSFSVGADCLETSSTTDALRFDDLIEVDAPPNMGWTAPLHPEPIE